MVVTVGGTHEVVYYAGPVLRRAAGLVPLCRKRATASRRGPRTEVSEAVGKVRDLVRSAQAPARRQDGAAYWKSISSASASPPSSLVSFGPSGCPGSLTAGGRTTAL
jgi:hypothetical protein